MRRIVASLAGLLVGIVPTAASAAPSDRPRPSGPPDRYVVVFRDTVADADAKTDSVERGGGVAVRHRYRHALKGFAAAMPPARAEALRRDPDVLAVVPDTAVRAAGSVALASGDVAPTGVRRIGAATSTQARPASVATVAVVDSGVDLAHRDLNVVSGVNCVSGGTAADDNGHGTHVAGTIAARNDGTGVVGVAPGTRLVAVKVLDAQGGGSSSSVICGVDWLTATRTDGDPSNDVHVANLSLGGPGSSVRDCASTTDPLHRAICRATAAGVTFVVAAGNDGWDFDYAPTPDVPAAYPEVLTVAAMADADGSAGAAGGTPSCDTSQRDDSYATYSNFATGAAGAAHLVAAPGTCIRSTWPGGSYATSSGTSMAAPHVAGAVALCLGEVGASSAPCAGLRPAAVIERIRTDAAAGATTANGFAGDPTRPVSGRAYGHVVRPAPITTTPPPSSPTTASSAPTAVTLQNGTTKSGGASQLAADDNLTYQIASTTSSTYTTSWYGRFTGIDNAVRSMSATIRSRYSRACEQSVWFYRFTNGSWVQVDLRNVATTETAVVASAPTPVADFVSGASGTGEVRVRIRCRTTGGAFTSDADQLRLDTTR